MSRRSAAEVKRLILSCCSAMGSTGPLPGDPSDDFDLRLEGVVDSLGFLTLLAELEERLGCEIQLEGLDPEHLTRLGPLARYIAERA